jgi:hypothetical protein
MKATVDAVARKEDMDNKVNMDSAEDMEVSKVNMDNKDGDSRVDMVIRVAMADNKADGEVTEIRAMDNKADGAIKVMDNKAVWEIRVMDNKVVAGEARVVMENSRADLVVTDIRANMDSKTEVGDNKADMDSNIVVSMIRIMTKDLRMKMKTNMADRVKCRDAMVWKKILTKTTMVKKKTKMSMACRAGMVKKRKKRNMMKTMKTNMAARCKDAHAVASAAAWAVKENAAAWVWVAGVHRNMKWVVWASKEAAVHSVMKMNMITAVAARARAVHAEVPAHPVAALPVCLKMKYAV